MYFKSILVKYGEIGIKGKNRYLFEDALMDNIRFALQGIDAPFEVTKESGRILVTFEGTYDYEEAVSRLTKVFGIVHISPVVVLEDKSFDAIARTVGDYMEEYYGKPDFTFKVICKRADKHFPKTSMEAAADLGEYLLDRFDGLRVDVHKPEVGVHVKIRNCVYIYSVDIPGPGGMPVGTNGRATLLLSGGIDSPVAGYMIAKRGVKIDAVYFHAPPYTSERAKQKVVDLARIVSRYAGPIRLHVINFTEIQLAIYDKCPHEELTIIMRRYMMRIAQSIALDEKSMGLITGESIGQVASQTMQSLMATNAVCTLPVYRPLIGFDKNDIVDVSQKIGTYETSIEPFEDCCTIFVAKHPVTKPNVHAIERSEHHLADVIDEMVKRALDTQEIIECS